MQKNKFAVPGLMALALLVGGASLNAQNTPTMLKGNGWNTRALFTVSETFGTYQPAGILDGIGAFADGQNRALVLVNHELSEGNGYAYSLANGTQMTGARVSAFQVERIDGCARVIDARLAYDRAYDRQGNLVVSAAQINETGDAIDGFARFCSGQGVRAGTYGFVDDIFFTGEETSKPFHPHGGTEWAVDVHGRAIWAVPAMGRGGWENVCAIDTGNVNTVGLLLGDDVQSAPLYLYIGQKNALGDQSFLDRNGLKVGQVYVWKSDAGDLDPGTFNGEGSARTGTFVPLNIFDPSKAGTMGYDAFGYMDGDTQRNAADALGAFSFSRPEDLHTNPANGTEAVFASTGRGALFPADNWGTVYKINVDFQVSPIGCNLEILHDADGLAIPDEGIRSPDNLTWANDGKIYVQEDRSTSPGSLFGAVTGIDASIWELDPTTNATKRIATVDRSVVLPLGSTDIGAGDIGNWETSGILDVTDLFDTDNGEVLLLATVQAHGIRDGLIGDNPLLDEGGQLVMMSKDHDMLSTATAATQSGFEVESFFTVSETINGYQPAGILDGTGAYPAGNNTALILVNHELSEGNGYAYSLPSGAQLTGARVSSFLVRRNGCDTEILSAGLAYDEIYDRDGNLVTSAGQVNETGHPIDGFARFCSAQGVRAGTYGFVDDLYFTGEETGKPFHPHGGTEWADRRRQRSRHPRRSPPWAAAPGRTSLAVETGDPDTVALVLGDDSARRLALYLYVGQKNALGNDELLPRPQRPRRRSALRLEGRQRRPRPPDLQRQRSSVRTGTFVTGSRSATRPTPVSTGYDA
jgi:secreted PhoX family phosphatase